MRSRTNPGAEVTMGRQKMTGRWGKATAAAAMFAALTGCAGKTNMGPVFWPPAPDLPRVQYLRAIKDSRDVVDQKAFNLLALGEDTSTTIPIVKPFAIAAVKGKVYLTDTVAGEVLIIDLPGKKMSRLKGNVNIGKLSKPVGITADDDGNIYVADTSRLEVLQYDPDGNYVRSFGKKEKIKPTDVKAEGEFLYILDGSKSRILVFDRKSGEMLKAIGQEGPDIAKLNVPLGLAADGKGGLYTTNFDGRVVELDRDGHFLKEFGKLGDTRGEFGRPKGIAVDQEGLVYIVDAAFQNTRIFNDQFQLLMDFGTPGTRGSLNVPAGIAVSADNLDYYQRLADPDFVIDRVIFVVSQFGDHKVSIYGLGKKKGVDYDAEYRKIQEEIGKKEKEIEEKKREEEQKKKQEQGAKGDGSANNAGQPAPAEGK